MNSDEIRRIIEHSALERNLEYVMKLLRPAVGMRTHIVDFEPGDLALGASRMGGAPDLPPGMDWPENKGRPMEFLAQIDFAAAARVHALPGLPATGWLAFFFDFRTYCEGGSDDQNTWRVFSFKDDPASLVRAKYPGEPEERFSLCEIEFEREDCLPPIGELLSRIGPRDDKQEEELWEYLHETLEPMENGPYHRLGGYPSLIQTNLQDYAGWDFLLQIDSDDSADWMWGDMGKLYFWIDPDDLKAGRLEKAWCVEEFH